MTKKLSNSALANNMRDIYVHTGNGWGIVHEKCVKLREWTTVVKH